MTSFLRTPPAHDPRPEPTHPQVIAEAVKARHADLVAWCNGRIPAEPEAITFAVEIAMRVGFGDGFRVGTVLKDRFGWPVDMTLTRILQRTCDALLPALRFVTGQWVARTGIRFPGVMLDIVEFLDADGTQRSGRVRGVDNLLAQAVIDMGSDPVKGDWFVPDAPPVILVPAEQVIANVTQSRFEPETPVLGARYENAPALAAAAEAEYQKRPRREVPVEPLPTEKPDPRSPSAA